MFYFVLFLYCQFKFVEIMKKSITIHSLNKDKTKCSVTLCDLMTGKNKTTFVCSIDSVSDIVKCNLDDNYYE